MTWCQVFAGFDIFMPLAYSFYYDFYVAFTFDWELLRTGQIGSYIKVLNKKINSDIITPPQISVSVTDPVPYL